MSDPLCDSAGRCRLAVLGHVDAVTGNVAMTCRYFGISRQLYYTWLRRYRAEGLEGLRDRSRRPKSCPHATHTDVVEKILHLRQNYHFGPTKISMYLKRYHDVVISAPGSGASSNGWASTGCRPPSAISGATAMEAL